MLDRIKNPRMLIPATAFVLGLSACGGNADRPDNNTRVADPERTEWTIDNIAPNADSGTDLTIQTTTVPVETGEYQDIDVIVRCEPKAEIVLPWTTAANSISLAKTDVCADDKVTKSDEEAIIAAYIAPQENAEQQDRDSVTVNEVKDFNKSLIVTATGPKVGQIIIKLSCERSADSTAAVRQNTMMTGLFSEQQYSLTVTDSFNDACTDDQLSVSDNAYKAGDIVRVQNAEHIPYFDLFAPVARS